MNTLPTPTLIQSLHAEGLYFSKRTIERLEAALEQSGYIMPVTPEGPDTEAYTTRQARHYWDLDGDYRPNGPQVTEKEKETA